VPRTAAVNHSELESDNVLEMSVTDAEIAERGASDDEFHGEPASRFRRRLERFKGLAETHELPGSLDDEAELRLQLMLLREENARLKAARHQPPSPGTAIDRVRMLSTPATDAEQADDAWSVLADCLVIRESLDQACVEIQRAISSVRDRLDGITDRIDASTAVTGAGANGGDLR
jgi:hypothetical protein